MQDDVQIQIFRTHTHRIAVGFVPQVACTQDVGSGRHRTEVETAVGTRVSVAQRFFQNHVRTVECLAVRSVNRSRKAGLAGGDDRAAGGGHEEPPSVDKHFFVI